MVPCCDPRAGSAVMAFSSGLMDFAPGTISMAVLAAAQAGTGAPATESAAVSRMKVGVRATRRRRTPDTIPLPSDLFASLPKRRAECPIVAPEDATLRNPRKITVDRREDSTYSSQHPLMRGRP